MFLTAILCAISALLALTMVRLVRRGSLSPPGPPGLPLMGNLLDMTSHEMWQRVWRWAHQYGGLVYIRILGTPILFLNSPESVNDLLHKRGAIYSDRAHSIMACDMAGFENLVPLTRYGEKFKLERRLMNQALGLSIVERWQPLIAGETHALLNHLLEKPDEYLEHFKRFAGSVIFTTIYGYHVSSSRDQYLEDAEEFMLASGQAMSGGWIVDSLPFLRYIPGLNMHRIAADWRKKLDIWVDKPHRMFKALPDSATKRGSFCGNLLLNDDGNISTDPELEHRVKWLATSLYGPGSDTTVVSLTMLLLALVHNPQVLKKAQRMLDKVVGTDRLPTYSDRPQLPYIDCIIKEVLRWGTPVPLTPAHRLIQPDQYRGYELAEGTLCVANMWAVLHDEDLYPDPDQFCPERFELEKDSERMRLIDPYNYAFGFGRRKCPGLHFADQSLWLTFASIMACFDVSPAVDENGKPLLPELQFGGGVFRHPKPFKCRITPRRPAVESLIHAAIAASI